MCTKYWLTACSSLPRKKCGYPAMTIAVDLGHKATKQTNKLVLKQFVVFLRVAFLHWFYFKQKKIDWISKLDAIISSLICNICSNVYQIEKKVF